ncbi:hypothetical protein [Fodinicola acaciae]|uniref:hypothetical protein n=1 Tax=Fodinicola acaciae TaxID=2681555 RepID=UPI0013D5AA39|nr:hypothetical protein [Fodinicola acaciae]
MRNRLALSAVAALAAMTMLVSGCGPSKTTASGTTVTPSVASTAAGAGCRSVGTIKFDKTKFVLHAGLAFGAFHHWVWKPFKNHAFQKGQKGRITALVKAALATAFTIHELKVAKADAESSPTLCKLVAPLDNAGAYLSGLAGKVRNGSVSDAELSSANSQINGAQTGAAADGAAAPDQVPTDRQLASGGA